MKFQDTSTVSIFIPGLSNSQGSKKSPRFHNFVTEVTHIARENSTVQRIFK